MILLQNHEANVVKISNRAAITKRLKTNKIIDDIELPILTILLHF